MISRTIGYIYWLLCKFWLWWNCEKSEGTNGIFLTQIQWQASNSWLSLERSSWGWCELSHSENWHWHRRESVIETWGTAGCCYTSCGVSCLLTIYRHNKLSGAPSDTKEGRLPFRKCCSCACWLSGKGQLGYMEQNVHFHANSVIKVYICKIQAKYNTLMQYSHIYMIICIFY